jgi:hypothetical protein
MHSPYIAVGKLYLWNSLYSYGSEVELKGITEFIIHKWEKSNGIFLQTN